MTARMRVFATASHVYRALVVATGGLSIPKMGATPFGYEVARRFGLPIVECRAALVPFTFNGADRERFDGLAGVSTDVTARACGHRFRYPRIPGGG